MSTLPYSAIGLTIGLMSGGKIYVKHGAIIFVGGGPLNLARMLPGKGITLGNVIFIDKTRRMREDPGLLAHELTHVKQYRTYGAFFGPLYVGEILASGSYWKAPFEEEAYKVEDNYNYEWVRSGKYKGAPPPELPGPYSAENITGIETGNPEPKLLSELNVNMAGGL